MTITFETIYQKRCTADGKPHFWNPQPMRVTPYCLYGDVDLPIESEWSVESAIEKVLALGLQLELPVGEWISELSRKEESQFSPTLKLLLKSNIRDEAAHFKGFSDAVNIYGVSDSIARESEHIAKCWLEDTSTELEKACYAETGVFLVTLSILRLAGGSELSKMAEEISKDETRHVSTNRGTMNLLGMDYTKPSRKLSGIIFDTIDWICGDLSIPGSELGEKFDFNNDFLQRSSMELIKTGIAKDLNNLMSIGVYSPPFENSNASLYSRVVLD
jgi:hypothetical protein